MMAQTKRYQSGYIRMGILMVLMAGCNPTVNPPDDGPATNPNTGFLIVEFNLPEFHTLPESRVHRSNLCVGQTADSMYRGLFIDCANVSDLQKSYTFKLPPGIYYYQAAITCSAYGDSCLWGGFPGGRMGERWSIERVVIEKGKTTNAVPDFQ